jgi:hypothetical protein
VSKPDASASSSGPVIPSNYGGNVAASQERVEQKARRTGPPAQKSSAGNAKRADPARVIG